MTQACGRIRQRIEEGVEGSPGIETLGLETIMLSEEYLKRVEEEQRVAEVMEVEYAAAAEWYAE